MSVTLFRSAISDVWTVLILVGGFVALLRFRVDTLWLIGGGALVGFAHYLLAGAGSVFWRVLPALRSSRGFYGLGIDRCRFSQPLRAIVRYRDIGPSEVMTQPAFYVGRPWAISAILVAIEIFKDQD